MNRFNIGNILFKFSSIGAITITLFVFVIDLFFKRGFEFAIYLLILFLSFLAVFALLYLFYILNISKRIENLNERIKQKLFTNEIPKSINQLEEPDAITTLNSRVESLISLKETENEYYKNLDSYRKEYLGNVSHELKTPIFNIQGYVDTLINGGLNDETINLNYLKRVEKSTERLIQIIDDLETITQLETGELILDIDVFDIAQLIKDVYTSLEIQASKKNIKLELAKKYEKPILVNADKYRIRQVLVNLITNSIKYGKENGKTITEFNYLNDDVLVEIKDNGDGIEASHLPRLFERFYRVDKGRSREQGGTGLGLSIVKHIIDAHNKSIVVESEIGKGTKFIFSLTAA
ncbi:MAG: ATP-binding protein [Bacteroidia bacterium]